jgi:beta-mannanase
MNYISNFINNIKYSNKINLIIKDLLLEYKKKDLNMIIINELYNNQTSDIYDVKLIEDGRKKLITEINKIKDKEFGINQILLEELVKNLIGKSFTQDYDNNEILELYDIESKKITDNYNLIRIYRSILLVKIL